MKFSFGFPAILLLVFVFQIRASAQSVPDGNGTPGSAPAPIPTSSSMTMISKIAGSAGSRYVTTREVQVNYAVDQVLNGPKAGGVQFLKIDSSQLNIELEDVMMEWAVYLEASSFATHHVEKSEVQRVLQNVETHLSPLAAWQSLEVAPTELRTMIERKLLARDFMRIKTDASLVPVSDTEAMAYYKKNRLKFGNLPFSSFRENIRTFLVKQQMDRRLRDWFDVLSRKYKVRNLLAG